MKLLLVRHGQTRWNTGEVFRGRADIELDATGIRQAELLAEHLKERPVEAVYSSPLQRALRTAEIAAAPHGGLVQIAPQLIDMDFGKWEGMSASEVRRRYPELYALWMEHPDRVKFPGGETLADVRKRAASFVQTLPARHREDVVVVSHRVVHKLLILALLGLDDSHFWDIRLDTCGTTTFAGEGSRLVLTGHNDTSYLKTLRQSGQRDF